MPYGPIAVVCGPSFRRRVCSWSAWALGCRRRGRGPAGGVHRLVVGHALPDLGRDDPLVRDDPAVFTVEARLESAIGHHHRVPLPAADPRNESVNRLGSQRSDPGQRADLRIRPHVAWVAARISGSTRSINMSGCQAGPDARWLLRDIAAGLTCPARNRNDSGDDEPRGWRRRAPP